MAKETYPKPGRGNEPRIPLHHAEFTSPEKDIAGIQETAATWQLTQLLGTGKKFYLETNNLDWAVAMGKVLRGFSSSARITLYACSPTGRAALLNERDWDLHLERWKQREAHTETRGVQTKPSRAESRAAGVARRTPRVRPK